MKPQVTCDKPTDSPTKKELWQETIKAWDHLVESGYGPSDFSGGEIKMNYQGFKKLVEENTKHALVKETRHYRINVVYIGNIEVSFTEVKIDKDDWLLEHNWSPLE